MALSIPFGLWYAIIMGNGLICSPSIKITASLGTRTCENSQVYKYIYITQQKING